MEFPVGQAYDARFGSPTTEGGQPSIPLSEAALALIEEQKRRVKQIEPRRLVFSTRGGMPISPDNVLRRSIFPVRDALKLKRTTWLTFRRTYSSWLHDQGVLGKVIAPLMGHANVDTTLNVCTQVLNGSLGAAVVTIESKFFTIVHHPENPGVLTH
jgi:integrase